MPCRQLRDRIRQLKAKITSAIPTSIVVGIIGSASHIPFTFSFGSDDAAATATPATFSNSVSAANNTNDVATWCRATTECAERQPGIPVRLIRLICWQMAAAGAQHIRGGLHHGATSFVLFRRALRVAECWCCRGCCIVLIRKLNVKWDVETLINIPTTMLVGIALVIFAFNLANPITQLAAGHHARPDRHRAGQRAVVAADDVNAAQGDFAGGGFFCRWKTGCSLPRPAPRRVCRWWWSWASRWTCWWPLLSLVSSSSRSARLSTVWISPTWKS